MEIEVKLRVADFEAVRAELAKLGAKRIGEELEINTFLDTPDHALLKQGAGLRVRRAEETQSGAVRVTVTHKGARVASAMKVRPETELRVDDYAEAIALLGQLGFQAHLTFEKRRETWELGSCEVVLDELPGGMGKFVEIEGGDEACIAAVRTQLKLDAAGVEPRGYASLISAELGRNGSELRFAAR